MVLRLFWVRLKFLLYLNQETKKQQNDLQFYRTTSLW
jgi:hypothetical protein